MILNYRENGTLILWSSIVLMAIGCGSMSVMADVISGMRVPLVLGTIEKTVDELGADLVGNAMSDSTESDLVQILWATNGIFAPQIGGDPDEQNPIMMTTRIGNQTALGMETPSIFAVTLPDGGHIPSTSPFFVRIFNAPTPLSATYYGDSQIVSNAGATRIIVSVPATSMGIEQIDPDLDSDGDGMTDVHEAIAGTDAHNASSVLSAQISYASGEHIQWQAVIGKVYSVERNEESLMNPIWEPINTVTATTESVELIFTTEPDADRYYYRIRVVP